MNQDQITRKEQILRHLQSHLGEWVDGTELATEAVGGSEGLRRLRDLRSDGYSIQQRRHPNPARDIWQYRLIDKPDVSPLRHDAAQPRGRLVFGLNQLCSYCEGKGTRHGQECPHCFGRGWL